jgi:hypothetical protein
MRHRHIILIAIFVALAVAIGQDPIPNVELVSATIFLSGMMQEQNGVLVGAMATFLFFFNAYGPAAPPLLVAQITSMMLVGLAGGWVRFLGRANSSAWLLGFAGWALTFVYDLLTTLSSTIIVATGRRVLTAVAFGLLFLLLHQASNLLIFALVLPYLLRRLRPAAGFSRRLANSPHTTTARAATFDQPRSREPMKRMQRGALLAFIILLPWFAAAQVPNPTQKADSLHQIAIDSTYTRQTVLADSTSREKLLADSLKLTAFPLPHLGLRLDPATASTYLFQDFTHIASQTLPLISLFTGEAGQPRYLALGDLPARTAQIIVDDVRWIAGVYGTADHTSLPDAHLQIVEAGAGAIRYAQTAPSPFGIRLASDSLRYGAPFSRIDYAKGPAGADAVRVRFGRALSKRLTVYANGTFSSADGRTIENINGQFNEGPYDGQKVSLQFDYYVNSKWKLRYRHFSSRNEAGVAVPFFPEEWAGISQALHKEVRLYHALELASAKRFSLRGFYWQIKEELNDPGRQVRHHLRDGALKSAGQDKVRHGSCNCKIALALNPSKAQASPSTTAYIRNSLPRSAFNAKNVAHLDGNTGRLKDWPYGAGFAANLINQPSCAAHLVAGSSIWRIPPAPGERENMLSELKANNDLRPADLQRGEIGVQWRRQRFDLHLRLNGSIWKNGYVYRIASAALFNSDRRLSVFAAQLHLDWEFAARWHLAATSAQAINQLP